ncbi:hypothetical protein FRC01_012783, partial [Tulasnella sp. 417]
AQLTPSTLPLLDRGETAKRSHLEAWTAEALPAREREATLGTGWIANLVNITQAMANGRKI